MCVRFPLCPLGGGRRRQTRLGMIPDRSGAPLFGGSEPGRRPSPTVREQHVQSYQSVRVAESHR